MKESTSAQRTGHKLFAERDSGRLVMVLVQNTMVCRYRSSPALAAVSWILFRIIAASGSICFCTSEL